LFEEAGLPRRAPPPFLPDSGMEAIGRRGRPPQISSPKHNLVYSLGEITSCERALSLRAETEPDVAKVYWFADRTFLGVSNRNAPLLWQPKLGRYQIVALDDHGRSDSCPVTICATGR